MSIGQSIRRILGPGFDSVARLYRSYYVDLDAFAAEFKVLDGVGSVVEIGCGDGHLVEAMTRAIPDAAFVGIDVAGSPGGLFKGDAERVEFVQKPAGALADEGRSFDLVVLCDVLHHVQAAERPGLMKTAWDLVSETGYLAVKDWVATSNLATRLAYLSDTYVTADRPDFFDSVEGFETLVLGDKVEKVAEGWVRPHQNNVFVIARR